MAPQVHWNQTVWVKVPGSQQSLRRSQAYVCPGGGWGERQEHFLERASGAVSWLSQKRHQDGLGMSAVGIVAISTLVGSSDGKDIP